MCHQWIYVFSISSEANWNGLKFCKWIQHINWIWSLDGRLCSNSVSPPLRWVSLDISRLYVSVFFSFSSFSTLCSASFFSFIYRNKCQNVCQKLFGFSAHDLRLEIGSTNAQTTLKQHSNELHTYFIRECNSRVLAASFCLWALCDSLLCASALQWVLGGWGYSKQSHWVSLPVLLRPTIPLPSLLLLPRLNLLIDVLLSQNVRKHSFQFYPSSSLLIVSVPSSLAGFTLRDKLA